jgi:hypothetical protein
LALTFVNQIGAVEGMNQAAPGTLIPESFVRWSQDVLFDRAGLMRRRGPFDKFDLYKTNPVTGLKEVTDFTRTGVEDERILAVLSTYDPTGAERIGMLVDSYEETGADRRTILRVFDNTFTFLGEETLPFDVTPLSIVSAKPALGGGLWVSIADDPANSDTHYQFFWRGGYSGTSKSSCSVDFSNVPGFFSGGHGSSTHTHGTLDNDFSIPDDADISIGQFVYVEISATDYRYIGVVKDVDPNTVTLEKHPFIWLSSINQNVGKATPSAGEFDTDTPYGSLTLKFVSVRPYEHVHGRGLLSTSTLTTGTDAVSGTVGTSGEGHWRSANVAGWNVYRASDNAYFGRVNTITDNTNFDFYEHTGIVVEGEEYVMRDPGSSTSFPQSYRVSERAINNFGGLYTSVYAGYQWYGNLANDDQNTNRVVFSAAHDHEAVDLSLEAADSIIFPGKSKFRGLGASSAGLLVFLEDRTYILRGNDRTNFSVEQLVPEGCLCPSSIVEYGGGVFWSGKSGIMFFDGASVRNLTKDNLGLYYTDSLDVFNPEQDRVIGFMHKNNLIMHYTSWKSPFDPIRYEPLYAADWSASDDKYGFTSWTEFDSDFDYDDFFTQNNTPIYWDRKILNNPEESSSTGSTITWSAGGVVTNKSLTSNVATLTISNGHGINVNDQIIVSNVDATFNGTYIVTAKTNTTISYAKTATDVASTAVTVTYPNPPRAIKSAGGLWGSTTNIQKYGPLRKNTSITFAVYLPTNSLTTLSNMDFRGVTAIETVYGLKTILGVNSVESNALRARLIDIHPVFDTNSNGDDAYLVEKINLPYSDLVRGPDFYLQTKHFTVGDPVLRKWFQRVLLNMLLYDGAVRMDIVDDDDNDDVDIKKKKHKNWEVFVEKGYDWDYLGKGEGTEFGIVFPKITSPRKSTWGNVEAALYDWDELFTSDFNRYSKRISWRKGSVGFRLYQLNDYKKPYNGVVTRPTRLELQGFSIGFKPLRQGRI